MATVTKPVALDESLNTTDSTPKNIADVLKDKLGDIASAISGGGGGSGQNARKADLTNLDLTGTTNTTGSTIASGTYFYLNGTLVRAKTDIASGATFTLNTNYEVVTVGGLNDLSEQIKSKIPMIEETTITMSVAAGYTEHATYSFPEKSGYSRAMTVVQNLSGSGSATCSIHLNGAPWTGDVYVYSPSVAASLTITLRCLYLPSI